MKFKIICILVILGILGLSLVSSAAPVEVGEKYSVTIEDIAREGDGIARIDGFVIFVGETKLGDKVTIQIDKVMRRFAIGHKIDQTGATDGNNKGNPSDLNKIYVIGHKNADADSVISAIAYANLKNELSPREFVPAVAGDLNNETKFALDFFKVPYPEKITDATGKKVILVDHNEMIQSANKLNIDNIYEVIDHHKISGLATSKPIFILIEPVGATSTIIAKLYEQNNVTISPKMAGLMMFAIFSDTAQFKSPTCTLSDKTTVDKLVLISGINPLGLMHKRDIYVKPAKEILMGDFKRFDFSGTKAGIGQIEVTDLAYLAPKRASLLDEMDKIRDAEKLNMVILMQTDTTKNASDILFVGNNYCAGLFEKALDGKITNHSLYKENCISRKKQIVPLLEAAFKK
jgi:manganese-dependent inorganic pyrophosphatase